MKPILDGSNWQSACFLNSARLPDIATAKARSTTSRQVETDSLFHLDIHPLNRGGGHRARSSVYRSNMTLFFSRHIRCDVSARRDKLSITHHASKGIAAHV